MFRSNTVPTSPG